MRLCLSEGDDGQKRVAPVSLGQPQPLQRHLLPGQRGEDCGLSCSLLLALPAGTVPQRCGRVGLFAHPLQIALHHIPEEHRGGGHHHDLHFSLQGRLSCL